MPHISTISRLWYYIGLLWVSYESNKDVFMAPRYLLNALHKINIEMVNEGVEINIWNYNIFRSYIFSEVCANLRLTLKLNISYNEPFEHCSRIHTLHFLNTVQHSQYMNKLGTYVNLCGLKLVNEYTCAPGWIHVLATIHNIPHSN